LDCNEARDDGVAVVSAGPYADHLHLSPDRKPRQHLITQCFTGQMLFLISNQQCLSIEGNPESYLNKNRVCVHDAFKQTVNLRHNYLLTFGNTVQCWNNR